MKKMLNWIVTMFFVASIFCGVSCTASATDETPPAEVQGFVITEQDSYLLLSWINPLDEDFSGVEISMNPAEGSLDNPVNLKKDVTECKVYGLQTEIEYNFTIKTFDKSENFSEGLSYSYTIEKEPEINEPEDDSDDGKTDEDKPTEDKPDDGKTDEDKPTEDKPDDGKTDEDKPTEDKPDDGKTDEDKPTEDKPDDGKTDEDKTTEDDKPSDEQPETNEPENTPTNPTNSTAKELLNQAIDLLMDANIDEGVAKIKAAYNLQKNDETKLYYALAELASISVDSSVSTLLIDNFGIKNYPAKMNALINGTWLKEYKFYEKCEIIEISQDNPGSDYVRVNGDESFFDGEYVHAKKSRDGIWYDPYTSIYLTNISLDENGPYLMGTWNLPENIDYSNATKYSRHYTGNYREVEVDRKAPEFYYGNNLPAIESAGDLGFLLLYNVLYCNINGFNDAVDNLLAVFGSKFNTAKTLVASMSNASVEVPQELFDALDLEDLLGQSSLKIGKAELNILIAAMDILQGFVQWISSYDWSVNLRMYKDYYETGIEPEFSDYKTIVNSKTLSVRNASAMTDSKNSFIEAVDLLVESYDYLVNGSLDYPQFAIDEFKEAKILKSAALKLKSAINNGEIFYIPADDPFDNPSGEWDFNEFNSDGIINFEKFFTPGYFTNILERNSDGSLKLYLNGYCDIYDDVNHSSEIMYMEPIEVTSVSTFKEIEDIYMNWVQENCDTYRVTGGYYDGCVKINPNLIVELFGSLFGDVDSDDSLVWVFGNYID